MTQRERIADELLVLRSQEGDLAAFEELVGRWQQRLWRHAWRLLGREDMAWDVLQEAWIGIGRGLLRLEDAAAFPAWAYQIVSHKCRDRIRQERRRRKLSEAYWERLAQAESDAAATSRPDVDLGEALRQLSGPDRAILALRYDEGFDTAGIAAILGVPEGTVKSRLHWARKRLRAILEENSHEPA